MNLRIRNLPLICLFGLLAACGDDGSAATDATSSTSAGPSSTSEAGSTGSTGSTGGDASATDGGSSGGSSGGDSASASSSSGETAGPFDGAHCQEACENDDDCAVNGLDVGFSCVDKRCQSGDSGCTYNGECVALYSGWAVQCESQDQCVGQVCVDIGGGEGRCATAPTDLVKCEALLLQETTYPPIEGGDPIAVCAQTAAICEDGSCAFACSDDAQCTSPSAPVCNTESGDCECATDDHCADVPGASICSAGQCRCASDADCEGVDNADVCLEDGSCGCSSADVCTSGTAFDGTSYVCEPA
ncbi:MAG: hypothetical protein H6710_24750 [Myxococcales bacterium]|nr:hypothetical protein [Myxococcales bacterium]